jgi:hypothetical protein
MRAEARAAGSSMACKGSGVRRFEPRVAQARERSLGSPAALLGQTASHRILLPSMHVNPAERLTAMSDPRATDALIDFARCDAIDGIAGAEVGRHGRTEPLRSPGRFGSHARRWRPPDATSGHRDQGPESVPVPGSLRSPYSRWVLRPCRPFPGGSILKLQEWLSASARR